MPDNINGEVKQHLYRTALVSEVFLVLPRKFCQELEAKLAEASGQHADNHVVYEVKQKGPNGTNTTYIMCSDFTIRFGHKIILERW